MSQLSWKIVGQSGKLYNVGLYHGNKTGHLLVHCNFKILLIDFNVTETKSYSFFIEEEFCELEIERKDNRFYYEFRINKEADTPLNKERKILDRKHFTQTLLFFSIIAALVGGLVIGIPYFKNKNIAATHLNQKGNTVMVPAVIAIDSQLQRLAYYYIINGKDYSNAIPFAQATHPIPLQDGDEFYVKIGAGNVDESQIQWSRPTSETAKVLMDRATAYYLQLHPDTSRPLARCLIETAWHIKKMEGLALIFSQLKPPGKSSKYNRKTFREMITQPDFKNHFATKCL